MAQVCPHCQATNDDEATFCVRCSARLSQPTDTIIADFSAGQKKGGRSNLMTVLLIGGGVLACLVAIVAVVLLVLNWDQLFPPSEPTVEPPPTVEEVVETPTAEPPEDTPAPELPSPTPEPLPPTETPSPTPTPTEPAPTPNQYGLAVGIQARVFTTEGDKLRMRDAPGTQGQVVAILSKGTLLTIIGGPETDKDGLTWWQVRTSDGEEGWCVEFVEGIQTLQP